MRFQIRLLPVAIVGATLMLTVRVGDLWNESDAILADIGIASSHAADHAEVGEASTKGAAHGGAEVAALDEDATAGFRFDDTEFDPMMLNRAEIELLQSLNGRRKEIEKREREFELREKTLAAAERSLVERIDELRHLKAEVEGLLNQYDEDQEARLRSLVKIYENMKPKDAARILASLQGDILLDVIERMREAKAAPILAQLDPAKAQRVTVELAERNKFARDAGE
jgi:flagellar motility protein MotE (MotC chaperone)